ncbi:MYG1 family protein [Candidatus Nomurabacteria bacterium]|nr:MYG1 family protein [Candidatus Nomurabacteria bacterium]
MSFFTKKKILVTHNGTFHADDVFATATLSLLLDGNIKVIRTRDPKIIASADYVYDVGGEYNLYKNLFDHHQKGGAGKRENGIPYAAFGLVWKSYGAAICGSHEWRSRTVCCSRYYQCFSS